MYLQLYKKCMILPQVGSSNRAILTLTNKKVYKNKARELKHNNQHEFAAVVDGLFQTKYRTENQFSTKHSARKKRGGDYILVFCYHEYCSIDCPAILSKLFSCFCTYFYHPSDSCHETPQEDIKLKYILH